MGLGKVDNKMKNVNKMFIRSNPGTNFATNIRGISALLVFAVHTGGFELVGNFTSMAFAKNLKILASMAPVAFFIASGYVLSVQYSKSGSLVRFYIRRYLRLTPLYACVLVFLFFQQELTLKEVLYRVLYLDAFNSSLFLSDPYGIFWTIAIEFWCSLLIPVLVYGVSSNFKYFILSLTAIISLLGPYLLVLSGMISQHAFKSILVGVFPFAVGVFFARSARNNTTKIVCLTGMILTCCLMIIFIFFGGQTNLKLLNPWWVVSLFVSSFIGYSHNKHTELKNNNTLLYLGTICYGIYLTHIPMYNLLDKFFERNIFLISLLPVLMLSSLAYVLIEYPFTRIFKNKFNYNF
jgi:peptidoglycan/LPS O-acetylase OafA/YrhL